MKLRNGVLSLLLLSAAACPKPAPVKPEEPRKTPPVEEKKTPPPVEEKKAPPVPVVDWVKDASGLPEGNPLKTFQQKTLANGLRVYAVADRELPLFAARLVIPAGSSYDPSGRSGLAALTADLLSKGAGGKDAQALASAVESLGADLSVFAGAEDAQIATSGLARDAETLLGYAADVAFRPTLSADEFDRAKKLREGSLLDSFDDEGSIATDAMRGAFFGSHPYGHPTEGSPEGVKAITLDDLKGFHTSHFVPGGSFLVIVGDLDPAAALALAEKKFGDWKPGKAVPALPAFTPSLSAKKVVIVDKPDVTQVQFRLAWPGVAAAHPDEAIIDLVNTTLGGGFTSHLVDELRVNAGLTYSAGSRMVSLTKGGFFLVSTFTKKETIRQAVDLALKVVSDYHATKQSEVEFKGARAYLSGQFPLGIETVDGLCGSLAAAISTNQGPKGVFGYVDEIKKSTADKARSAIETYLPSSKSPYVLVAVGPADDLKTALSGLGDITVVPLGKHFGGN
jgi:predicted Zn-dependent peptidase